MDTLVSPNGTSTVVTDGGNNHGRHDNATDFFLHLASNAAANNQAIQVAIERVGRSAELATEKTAAAAMLLAAQDTAALQAAIAACCCEQKELTRAEGEATRALIREQEAARLRDEVQLLKLKVAGINVPV